MVDVVDSGRRPVAKDSLKSYEDALTVCPGVSVRHDGEVLADPSLDQELLKEWGPVREIWEAHAVDEEIRYQGSSGGVITALGLYCLEQKGMSGVLHVAPDPSQPYRNTTVISHDRTALLRGAGSRYSPASPCEKLHLVERASSPCVVVGKPCDIYAARSIAENRAALDEKIGISIACFCAGTPSTRGTLVMLEKMGVSDISSVLGMRYRGHGWPGNTQIISNNLKNNVQELTYEQAWGEILQKYRQWRCYICPDHTGEFADIAVGDPWYRRNEASDIGTSLVLIRSKTGMSIFSGALNSGYISARRRQSKYLFLSQPNLSKTQGRLWGQSMVLQMLHVPCPEYYGFFLREKWINNLTLREKIKVLVGTIKRIIQKVLYCKSGEF